MNPFEKNIGTCDRMTRAIAGIAALALIPVASIQAPLSWLFIFIGLALLFTAATQGCMLYSILGVRTDGKPVKKNEKMGKKKR